jgi:hypothetical protein
MFKAINTTHTPSQNGTIVTTVFEGISVGTFKKPGAHHFTLFKHGAQTAADYERLAAAGLVRSYEAGVPNTATYDQLHVFVPRVEALPGQRREVSVSCLDMRSRGGGIRQIKTGR